MRSFFNKFEHKLQKIQEELFYSKYGVSKVVASPIFFFWQNLSSMRQR